MTCSRMLPGRGSAEASLVLTAGLAGVFPFATAIKGSASNSPAARERQSGPPTNSPPMSPSAAHVQKEDTP